MGLRVLLLVAVVVAFSTATSTASLPGGASAHVVRCATEYGLPHDQYKPPPIPRRLPATTPEERSGPLTFYSNGWLTIVGPRGWRCLGIVGATGARMITVVPPGAKTSHGFAAPPGERVIDVYVASPGTGEVGIACALFPTGRMRPNPCTPIPKREQDVRLGPHVVAFEDPPHVSGTGLPSGGPYPVNGVMIYDGSKYPAWAGEETCALPESQHHLCSVVLNDFVARHPPR